MIVPCPTCGNSGDWCQSCEGIGRIVAMPKEEWEEIEKELTSLRAEAKAIAETDIQPKPGTQAPGPSSTRRKK